MMTRYIVGLEPLASLPAERVADLIAPTLQHYLTHPLTPSPSIRNRCRAPAACRGGRTLEDLADAELAGDLRIRQRPGQG